ncbi:MAG: T9SS type A sorting domain-containing protein, partial [Vicingaceae bacterium]
ISFPNDSVGFAVSRDLGNATTPSVIYKTINDGNSWQNITPAATNTGSGNMFVQFINANIGFWTIGNILYRTVDGGNNWDTTALGTPMNYFNAQSMHFYDANNGIIGVHDGTFAYLGSMFVTSDGGQTFIQTDLTNSYTVIGAVDQVSTTTSFAASAGWGSNNMMKLYRSTNSGSSWDTLPVNSAVPNAELTMFDFIDEFNGFVVLTGNVNGSCYLYKTTDGGLTWLFNDSLSIGTPYDIELTPNSGYLSSSTNPFAKYTGGSVSVKSTRGKNKPALLLYPNPITSGSIVTWKSEVVYDHLIIKDLSGKNVLNRKILGKRLKIPFLSPGYYFIQLSNKEQQETIPLVIQ